MDSEKSYSITLDDDPIAYRFIEKITKIKSIPFTSAKKLFDEISKYKNPVAIFIDVHLGIDESGLDVIPTVRKAWPASPIIVVTGDSDTNLIGQALAAGANDFVTKPLNSSELNARLQARIAEVTEISAANVHPVGDVTFNYKLRFLEKDDDKAYVSPMECEILKSLVEAKGMVVPREVLKRKLWGDLHVSDNALDRRISELRRAIKEVHSKIRIKSIYGRGLAIK